MMPNNPLRLGRTISWTAPTEAIAQNLERVLQNWPRVDAAPDIALGDLTAYNAGREMLTNRREQLQDEHDALEPLVKDGGTAAQKGKLQKLRTELRDVNELLRKSAKPEPGGAG